MNRLVWSVLYLSAVQIVLSQQETSKQCYTSKGTEGICKTQSECLALRNSPSDSEIFSETCRIETDGTPIVCCIVESNQKESPSSTHHSETKDPESSTSLNSNETQKEGDDGVETRFYSGPRKKQYIPHKAVYKTPTSNLISHYEPISYNDINPTNTYQKKTNQYNNGQNTNPNYGYQSNAFKGDQYPSNNGNLNSQNNYNYNPYASQSNNGFSNQNSNYNPTYQSQNNYNPSNQNSNSNSYPNYNQGSSANRPTRPPTGGTIVFKQPTRPNGNYRPTSSSNRPDLETNYWPTQSTKANIYPVWGEVSKSTSRTIREPRPTESSPYSTTSRNNNQQSSYGQQKRISEQKCSEYSRLVTQSVSAVPLSINSQVATVDVQDCPRSAVELIVGGSKAELGEFPHMVALGFRRGSSIDYSCGGTLISDEFVLTAAHCIKSSLGDPIHIRLGDLNLEKEDDGAQPQIIGVQEIVVHPRYNPPQLYHDIALIRMSRKVYFNKMLRPACLYPAYDVKSQKVVATGWGSTNYGEISSDDLLKVVLNIIDNKQCTTLYGTDTKLKNGITNDMLCAGELSGKRDTCQGDSGGPLQISSPSNRCVHYVVGITSFGRSCGVANSAGIYTRVSQYVDWIESVVWKS